MHLCATRERAGPWLLGLVAAMVPHQCARTPRRYSRDPLWGSKCRAGAGGVGSETLARSTPLGRAIGSHVFVSEVATKRNGRMPGGPWWDAVSIRLTCARCRDDDLIHRRRSYDRRRDAGRCHRRSAAPSEATHSCRAGAAQERRAILFYGARAQSLVDRCANMLSSLLTITRSSWKDCDIAPPTGLRRQHGEGYRSITDNTCFVHCQPRMVRRRRRTVLREQRKLRG